MAYNIVRKGGIPAWACAAFEGKSSVEEARACSLVIEHSEVDRRATISLIFSLPLDDPDDKQAFALLYDADNLMPGVTWLGDPTTRVSPPLMDAINRHGNIRIKMLSLALKTYCPVLCPRSLENLQPARGLKAAFDRFVDLAKATEVQILFDYNWVHRRHHARLERVVQHPEEFSGFRNGNNHTYSFELVDWTVFGPGEESVDGAPPSYVEAASNKRPRQGRSLVSAA